MRTIKLKSLSLVNFKGVRSFDVSFDSDVVTITGGNATGKTTLYDAYLWLLFGKDSAGRGDGNGGFNVKTLGTDGKPIYRLEHSVTGVFEIDGREIKLQRCLVEKWSKKNGSNEESMNDEQQYFINDVRCGTKKEYQAEISEIIPENVFRMITNPHYFPRLSADDQKDMLLEMVGNISDEEIAATDEGFMALLDHINGTSLIKFAQEIAAKKKSCNDALKTIPASIETAQKLMPEIEDWAALESELSTKKKSLAEIDAQLTDHNNTVSQANQRRNEIIRLKGAKEMALTTRQSNLRIQANADTNRAKADLQAMESELATLQRNIASKRGELADVQATITKLNEQIVALRDEFKAVAKEMYVEPAEGSLVCPTCGEPLRGENLTKQKETMRGNFEQHKAEHQKSIQAKGVPMRKELDRAKETETRLKGQISTYEDSVLDLKGRIEYAKAHIPTAKNADELIKVDPECIALANEIEELNNRLNAEIQPTDVSELQEAKAILSESIAELNRRLGKRDTITRCQKEIEELEEKRVANNQAITDLERWEDTYTRFLKAKDEILMERINGLFSYVSFSFLKEQKNGGEKLTCFCTVNGIPYPDVNAAGKLNAGLDIINAICRTKGISAPIFIDNAESVNEIIPTISQVVNLRVSTHRTLTIQ